MDHLDIVQRLRALEPATTFTTEEKILTFVLKVLDALPTSEGAGLLRKDAGENITWYTPAQCNVSISRVCYPDGQLYKILTDAGPGGGNGAGWADDGLVEKNRYIAIHPIPEPEPVPIPVPPQVCQFVPATPPAPVDLSGVISMLSAVLDKLVGTEAALAELSRKQDRQLTGNTRAFGGSLVLTPKNP